MDIGYISLETDKESGSQTAGTDTDARIRTVG